MLAEHMIIKPSQLIKNFKLIIKLLAINIYDMIISMKNMKMRKYCQKQEKNNFNIRTYNDKF
jgi:hypothetical protein